jgi:hypothetical protein
VKRATAAVLAACALSCAWASPPGSIVPFSTAGAGPPPTPWTFVPLRGIAPAQVEVVSDGATRVARLVAQGAAGLLVHPLDADTEATPILRWRWKVERVVSAADLHRREGDDFAARVYVTFALPDASLTLWERTRIRLARLFYGESVPAAALCYVWDNRNPVGTTAWNAHSAQVRMVVVESGAARAGRWVEASRDVAADYRAAFGSRYPGPVPRISGVAISADTDQTGESATSWFGDLALGAVR